MNDDDAVEVESPEGTDADAEPTAADPNGEADAESVDGTGTDAVDGAGEGNGAGENGASDGESLAERVADHDAALAEDVAALEAELAAAREEAASANAEVEELTSKVARVRADFKNYKERAKRKQEEIRERASEALVERIAPVRNDLLRALDQDEGSDVRPGVESTLEKFDAVLAEEGVDAIEPDPGAEIDPSRHQVMLRVESDQPEGTVHEVYEPGYEMGDRVIAEAQVTVSRDEE